MCACACSAFLCDLEGAPLTKQYSRHVAPNSMYVCVCAPAVATSHLVTWVQELQKECEHR